MKFQAAYSYLKRGHKVKLPEWGGYWYWRQGPTKGEDCSREQESTIIIHTRYGTELDIRDTHDVDYTFGFLFRDDWELLTDWQDEAAKEVESK